jgi:hypothetical protein
MTDTKRMQDDLTEKPEKTPPAGPHAKERLTDREKTPGTGALPEKGQPEADVGPD